MLHKWIVCRTEADQVSAFARAQLGWGDLSSVSGFLGQLGGWNQRPHEACILAAWLNHESYLAFMAEQHDHRFEQSGQAATYHSSEISLFDQTLEMPGSSDFESGAQSARVLRTADCIVRQGREQHFIDVQDALWRPNMAQAEGYIAGRFARATASRFLIASLWASAADHDRYGTEQVPELGRKAQVTEDVETIVGHTVTVQPEWTVEGNAQALIAAEFFRRSQCDASVALLDVVNTLRRMPYARASHRSAQAAVHEWRGTCSTKHLVLQSLVEALFPKHNVRLVHRVYALTRGPAAKLFGEQAAALVPAAGLTDVHTYAIVEIDGRPVTIDVTFARGQDWDGATSMPVASGEGTDHPAGPDPMEHKARLVKEHCEPSIREPFIAALSNA